MEMVRQDADGVRFERQARLNRAINLPQALYMSDKQVAGPVSKRDREKELAALDVWTPISRHDAIIARDAGRVRKIAVDPVPRSGASQGRFCTPYEECPQKSHWPRPIRNRGYHCRNFKS